MILTLMLLSHASLAQESCEYYSEQIEKIREKCSQGYCDIKVKIQLDEYREQLQTCKTQEQIDNAVPSPSSSPERKE